MSQHDGTTETELIRAARSGDGVAFEHLIQPLLRDLRAHVRQRIRNAPHVEADDVVSDTLETAWNALDRFVDGYPFRSFLFGIAKFAVLRAVTRRSKELPTDFSSASPEALGPIESSPGVEEAYLSQLHGLSAVERFETPEVAPRSNPVFHETLEAMFAHGGYPHQQIAFAYSVVIWGKPRSESRGSAADPGRSRPDKVPITGDAARVVSELGGAALWESGDGLRVELVSHAPSDRHRLNSAFEPFHYRLGLTGQQLFARDKASSARFPQILTTVVGRTCLQDYFGRNPNRSVAIWTEKVKKNTLDALRGTIDLSRSSLPRPPGPDNPASAP